MGDASLGPTRSERQRDALEDATFLTRDTLREVNVLVTGFGAFKSFSVNPSYLVASSLARSLNPESLSATAALKHHEPPTQQSIRHRDPRPYSINVHVYPSPLRVAYDFIREFIPRLIADPTTHETSDFVVPDNGFDYVLHIGLAAGRENYTLETVAHRDFYRLKDVADLDGMRAEAEWRILGLPEVIDIGWSKEDVLSRWEALTRQREDEYEQNEMAMAGWTEGGMKALVETARLRSQVFLGKGRRAVVKLSRDAGRYLCEFVLYTSLGTRWREARDTDSTDPAGLKAKEKVGKVAFLHVPGGTMPHDIARGVRVCESAILAIVGSWEDGYRNPDVYGGVKDGEVVTVEPAAIYEQKGTGDR